MLMRFHLYLETLISTVRTESAKKGTFFTGAQALVYHFNYLFLSLFVVVAYIFQAEIGIGLPINNSFHWQVYPG